jgi:hypothetical protein
MDMSKYTEDVIKDWWANVPFYIKEEITGFRMIDFSTEDGYKEFEEACNDWWEWLTLDNKIIYYQMYY